MGRVKRAADLQKQAEYAKAREAYTKQPKAEGTTVTHKPKAEYSYIASTVKDKDGNNQTYTITASVAAINWFSGGSIGNLGLAIFDAHNSRAPRHFKPAKIHATIGAQNVTYKHAKASGKSYPKYTATPGNNKQTSYSAPLCAKDVPSLITLANGLITSKREAVGGAYGRLWFTMEQPLIAENGMATTTPGG